MAQLQIYSGVLRTWTVSYLFCSVCVFRNKQTSLPLCSTKQTSQKSCKRVQVEFRWRNATTIKLNNCLLWGRKIMRWNYSGKAAWWWHDGAATWKLLGLLETTIQAQLIVTSKLHHRKIKFSEPVCGFRKKNTRWRVWGGRWWPEAHAVSLCEKCQGKVKGSRNNLAGQPSLSAISWQHLK